MSDGKSQKNIKFKLRSLVTEIFVANDKPRYVLNFVETSSLLVRKKGILQK